MTLHAFVSSDWSHMGCLEMNMQLGHRHHGHSTQHIIRKSMMVLHIDVGPHLPNGWSRPIGHDSTPQKGMQHRRDKGHGVCGAGH